MWSAPYRYAIAGGGWIFLKDDNARPDRTRIVDDFLFDKESFEWIRQQILGMNPIEQDWDLVRRMVTGRLLLQKAIQ